MIINKNKCGIMVFNSTHNKLTKWETNLKIRDIQLVDCYKYLGVELNKQLLTHNHI
jgi:hypothetical protein